MTRYQCCNCLAGAAGLAAAILLSMGTVSAAEDENTPLDEVVITGTTIKRINAETALPVQVLKTEDIERTGASTVEELVRNLASVDSAGARSASQATGVQTGAI